MQTVPLNGNWVLDMAKVAVCSRSFSKNSILREELLSRYEQVTFNSDGLQLAGDSLVDYLRGHEKAIIGLERIDEFVLARLPELKVISKYGVGLDKIDLRAMRSYGKRLGWIGGVNRRSVSELVITFAIALLRHIPVAHKEVLSGVWNQHVGRCLSNSTVGIIGCGNVGKDLVSLLRVFGCKILVHDIRDYPEFFATYSVEVVSLEEILSRSDIVTLHVPLDDSTRGMLDAFKLAMLKTTAVLINTARGGLVDEVALMRMLQGKRLAGAAFDVFTVEPPQNIELLSLPNFWVTPHIGGSTQEAILAMGRAAILGLDENSIPDAARK
jgi:phosphoglycerate dehydrogenase-like enzyme